MTIGEVARRARIQASAIRYYERYGLLPRPDRVSGRRRYDDSVIDLLALICFAREVGFSMNEVRQLFGPAVRGDRISKRWSALATHKIDQLEHRMRNLEIARELLRRVLACQCLDPAECGRVIRQLASEA